MFRNKQAGKARLMTAACQISVTLNFSGTPMSYAELDGSKYDVRT